MSRIIWIELKCIMNDKMLKWWNVIRMNYLLLSASASYWYDDDCNYKSSSEYRNIFTCIASVLSYWDRGCFDESATTFHNRCTTNPPKRHLSYCELIEPLMISLCISSSSVSFVDDVIRSPCWWNIFVYGWIYRAIRAHCATTCIQ